MNNLIPIIIKNQKVLTTKQLSEVYETSEKNISNNFNNNIEHFEEGKHFYLLKGDELRDFKRNSYDIGIAPSVNKLYLWTERGANRHCKILDTDKAWEQFDNLEETYFRVKSGQAIQPQSNLDLLELQVKALKEVDGKVQEVRKDLEEFKGDLPLIGDEPEELQAVVRSVGTKALGGYGCPAYKDKSLSARVFKNVWKYVKDQFNVKRYKSIKRKNLSKAIELAYTYEAPFYLQEEIDLANNQVGFKEIK